MDEIIFSVAFKQYSLDKINYPPASKASREIANLTERKIHKPPDRVSKNLSVWRATVLWTAGRKKLSWECLNFIILNSSVTLTPFIPGLATQNGLKKNLGHQWQKRVSHNFLFVRKVAGRARAEGQNSNVLTQFLT